MITSYEGGANVPVKLVVINDTQIKSANPKSRIDHYETTIINKMIETGEIAKTENANLIIHTGDMFDIPKISERLLGLIAEIIRSYGVPMVVVPGNHDIYGYNINTINNTSLGLLAKTGVVKLLTRAMPCMLDIDGIKVNIQGQEYHAQIDQRDPKLDYYIDLKIPADYYILAVHGMLISGGGHPSMPWTDISNIPPGPDYIFAGHWHPGFDPAVNQHSTRIFNYGSAVRDKATQDAKLRSVGVLVATLEKNKKHNKFEFIEFKYAQPADKVLDFNANLLKHLKTNYLANFKQALANASNFKAIDVNAILTNKATAMSMLQSALDGIQEAEQLVDTFHQKLDGYVDKGYSQYITEVEIVNFQSHKDTLIKFNSGTNAITGPSNNGKTAALRAIRWCLFNEPPGNEFMRTGASKSRVKIVFSDNTWIERERTRTAAGIYRIFDGKDVTEFKGFHNKMPPEIASIHQMPNIQFSKDIKTNLNIADQLSAPFLLSESPGTRALILGNLTGVDVIDAAIKETGRKAASLTKGIKERQKIIDANQGELANFKDLSDLELRIKKAEIGLELITNVQKEIQEIETEQITLTKLTTEIQDVNSLLAVINAKDINTLITTQHTSHLLESQIAQLIDLIVARDSYQQGLKQTTNDLSNFPDLDRLVSLSNNSITFGRLIRELEDAKTLADNLKTAISGVDRSIKQLPNFQQAAVILSQIDTSWPELTELEGINKSMQSLDFHKNTLLKNLDICQNNLNTTLKEYQDTLIQTGQCPTCNASLNSVRVAAIIQEIS